MRKETIRAFLLMGGLSLLILTGCKSSKKVMTVESTGSAKAHVDFFRSMESQAFQFGTMNARLNVEVDLPGQNVSSKVEMKMVMDSVFQLSIQPFLGIELFRIEFSLDSVKVIDRMNKRYILESYANLKGQTPIELNFYNLQALFTNNLFIPGERGVSEEHYNRFRLNQEGATAEIKIRDAQGFAYTFLADGEEKLLSALITDSLEWYAVRWQYDDFRYVDDQIFPMIMDVYVLKENDSQGGLRMNFSRIQLNEPLKMDFSIPAKYKQVTFAEVMKSLKNLKQ